MRCIVRYASGSLRSGNVHYNAKETGQAKDAGVGRRTDGTSENRPREERLEQPKRREGASGAESDLNALQSPSCLARGGGGDGRGRRWKVKTVRPSEDSETGKPTHRSRA